MIDEAWRVTAAGAARARGGDPFSVLSGRDGRPLARTVKCLIDPLVLRLRANPDLGKPLLDADSAVQVTELILTAGPSLADAAEWFIVLKAQRRVAGITGGNIQEQYFPRAFELAVSHGRPSDDAVPIAAETLVEIHRPSAGMSVDDLADYVEENHTALDDELQAVWARTAPIVEVAADLAGVIGPLLDDERSSGERDASWSRLTASTTPRHFGLRLFVPGTPIVDLLRSCGVTSGAAPALSTSTPAQMPELLGRQAGLPLDRPISARVVTTLRRSRDREVLPVISGLVADEIARSREPWALDGAVWHTAMLVGVIVAAQLQPLAPQPSSHRFVSTMSHRVAAQAHVMYNRRFLLDGADDELAIDLREFWRPYLSRLWVRLHGRSVLEPDTAPSEFDADSLLDLLDGIARSVSFDQRSRIRAAIERAGR